MCKRFKTLKNWLSFVWAICVWQTSGLGENWPRFLGPEGNNISRETNLLSKWPAQGPPLLWEKEIGSGYSAPSVQGRYLVVHHRVQGNEIVQALDAPSGSPLWDYSIASRFEDPFGYNNGPRATPLLTTNRCYTFGAGGMLTCLDLATGKLIWQYDTAKKWNVPEAFFGAGSSPILDDNRLVVMIGGQPNATLVAMDPETGKVQWESVGRANWDGIKTLDWPGQAPYHWSGEEKLASYSTPAMATIHGRRHLLCLSRQGLVSVNPTNGAIHFSRWFQSTVNESVNAMCPVISDDQVLISAAYYRIGAVMLRIADDGLSYKEVWRSPAQSRERDSATGRMVAPVLESHWSTPVLINGYLYAFSGRNEPDASFRCVEFATGKLMWNRDESWRSHSSPQPAVYGRGSIIYADGKLFVLGEGGKLGIFAPNPNQPQELSSWQAPQLHYPCWAGLVLANKKLYLRSEDRLLCFNLQAH